ncbi:hypothetical protein M406DRAFT_355876 [Cryphonectria parasitica EP155]|uniref:Ribosomal protein S36, mitochondrial n=1 Tax=Cryphonectria parasitica (strain ATCC 38755 / EP155) TaxID=660469 RepID=A0A9P5CPE5_CRYP1|nr:uncharacterized protein M406DRAFT_355876 [Cryphonectria parasitica EP155]KAF3765332.1 hypothetical protein M406DRAFT_355876 [Cryphonectria parasitica EP155]
MFATRALRQAAAHAERVPSIKFLGKRTIPSAVDHTPQPHPASPSSSLPEDFSSKTSHASFSEYRQRSQQYGPLRKTWTRTAETGIGAAPAAALPSINPANGVFFDRDELPARFRRSVWSAEEIEAIESGGASVAA